MWLGTDVTVFIFSSCDQPEGNSGAHSCRIEILGYIFPHVLDVFRVMAVIGDPDSYKC